MATLDPISRKSMESGIIVPGAVSESRRPPTSVYESLNLDFDSIGAARIRKGITQLGNSLSGTILGMTYFSDTVSASPKSQFIVVNGTTAYYLNSGSYASIRTGLTASSKARFSTFLNFVFMVNGADATAVWDGVVSDGFVTTGNALSAPIGSLVENFRSRMWIAGNPTYPSRLYYSSVPSSVTTPVVTWNTDVATGQWIDISPSDGEKIRGLHRTRGNMLLFKDNHIYKVYSISQTDPDPFYAVGTMSHESIVETKVGVFFHHSSGIYMYNIYGTVTEVSRPIIDFIKAITVANYTSIAGWLDPDGDHVNWSIGTVTVNGITYNNAVVRYTISTQTWTHRSYATQFVMSADYTDGVTRFKAVGDGSGGIYEYNTGNDDAGTEIPYSLIHFWDNMDGLLSTRKTIMTGMFSHYGGNGTKVAYQIDGDTDLDWSKGVGQLRDVNTGFNTMDIKARKVRFRIFGTSKGQQFTYNGYELIQVTNELLQFTP